VLVVVPQRDVPLVACSVLLRGSALADPRGKSGVAALTAGLLEKGAGARDAFAFADALEGVGGSLATAAGAELITLSAQFLARDQELMLGLLASALTEPMGGRCSAASARWRRSAAGTYCATTAPRSAATGWS